MKNSLAQVGVPIDPGVRINGIGPFGNPGGDEDTLFAELISTIIGIMTLVAFIWFVFLLITGAIAIMTSGGDKVKAEDARKRLTTGVIGLVVVIAAIFIMDIIATLLGIQNITDIPAMIGILGG